MPKKIMPPEEYILKLEESLKEAKKETRYFQLLSEEAGIRSVREIDELSQVIQKHVKAEKALKIKESQYRTTIDSLGDAIHVIDSNYRIVLTNESFIKRSEILGFETNAIDKQLFELFPFLDQEIFNEYEQVFKTGQLCFSEENMQIGNLAFTSETRKIPVFDGKKVYQVITVIHDITERKKMEMERQNLEEQLQIRQRIDSLGTLAGGIAHDINNLLVAIMGNVDLVRTNQNTLTQHQKDHIERAFHSCQIAANLIKDIQKFSKNIIFEKSNLDLYDIAENSFDMLRRTTDKLIEKKIEFKPGQIQVLANYDHLHQVFMNLGMNSIQAIEERGKHHGDFIRIMAKEYCYEKNNKMGLQDGEYIHILFEDNGQGMSDEVKKKAFDPLFTTRRGVQKGQGLGLAMVYNIIRKLDGYIDIETEEGKGTTFHLYLPKASACEKPEVIEGVDIKGGNETVLIVEDEASVREFVTDTLHMYGYNVLTAEDGLEGVETYKAHQNEIDLVLLDLTMPIMSGEMAFRKILEVKPDVKVIITSGHSEEEMMKITRVKGHIKKPYRITELIKIISKVLNN
ncbi:response regulator [Candidatus Latescibacterota bacterium]